MYHSNMKKKGIQAARSRGQRLTQQGEVMWDRDEQETEPGGMTANGTQTLSPRLPKMWPGLEQHKTSPLCSKSGQPGPQQTLRALNSVQIPALHFPALCPGAH